LLSRIGKNQRCEVDASSSHFGMAIDLWLVMAGLVPRLSGSFFAVHSARH
jgi:hypothetical protein